MKKIEVVQKFQDGTLVREFLSQIETDENEVIGFMLSSNAEKSIQVESSIAEKVIDLLQKPAISETTVVAVVCNEVESISLLAA